jgi:hypothetical protein
MVQTSLGAILAKCQDDFSRFKTQDYASVIKQGLVSLRIVLVRVSFFFPKAFTRLLTLNFSWFVGLPQSTVYSLLDRFSGGRVPPGFVPACLFHHLS